MMHNFISDLHFGGEEIFDPACPHSFISRGMSEEENISMSNVTLIQLSSPSSFFEITLSVEDLLRVLPSIFSNVAEQQ